MSKTTRKKAAGPVTNRRTRAVAAAGALVLLVVAGAWWLSNVAEEVPVSEVSHIHAIAVDRDDPEALSPAIRMDGRLDKAAFRSTRKLLRNAQEAAILRTRRTARRPFSMAA